MDMDYLNELLPNKKFKLVVLDRTLKALDDCLGNHARSGLCRHPAARRNPLPAGGQAFPDFGGR